MGGHLPQGLLMTMTNLIKLVTAVENTPQAVTDSCQELFTRGDVAPKKQL
jgi:hypothetical protein